MNENGIELLFLGTGAITTKARCASVLVNGNILVDVGYGAVRGLVENGYETVDISTIIITHFHQDHMGDIAYLLTRRYGSKKRTPLTIIGPKGLFDRIKDCYKPIQHSGDDELKFFAMDSVKVVELDINEKYKAGDLEVQSFPVEHNPVENIEAVYNCYGYIIRIGGASIGFSGDARWCKTLEQNIPNTKTWVIDGGAIHNPAKQVRHIGLETLQALATNHPDTRFFAVHRRNSNSPSDLPHNLIFPNDDEKLKVF